MEKLEALAKLNSVISKSRVEMYKPIQVAEVLHEARNNTEIQLSDLQTYRTQSKQLRDRVTSQLFGKVSTSSAKFQDDIWSETAVPPAAMQALGAMNAENGIIEEYIYQSIWAKNTFLISIRDSLENLSDLNGLIKLFADFDEEGMRSSADRLFEIFTVSVLQAGAELLNSKVVIQSNEEDSASPSCAQIIVHSASLLENYLQFSRIGHTNAADAGLDIWTNFGVIVSVKNYQLDDQLLKKVLEDTPIGQLVIACESVTQSALKAAQDLTRLGKRTVNVITKSDLMKDAGVLLGRKVLQFH